jgi:hypothetical protein
MEVAGRTPRQKNSVPKFSEKIRIKQMVDQNTTAKFNPSFFV